MHQKSTKTPSISTYLPVALVATEIVLHKYDAYLTIKNTTMCKNHPNQDKKQQAIVFIQLKKINKKYCKASKARYVWLCNTF